jgi:hypothetical protein
MDVVQNVEQDRAGLRHSRFRQHLSPLFLIDVAAHSDHKRKFSESGENFGLSYVSGMENQLGTAQGL